MDRKVYAYGRVSTREQNLDRQMAAFREYGIPSENIFVDKQSGKDFNRPAYKDMLKTLTAGDTLFASGEIRQIASVEKRQFGSAEIRQFESIEKSQS